MTGRTIYRRSTTEQRERDAERIIAAFPAIAADYRRAAALHATGEARAFGTEHAYLAFARWNTATAHALRSVLDVVETSNPEPYQDAYTQSIDIRHGRFVVSYANSNHPCWPITENVAFRIVHDVLGHHASGHDFSPGGEVRTFLHSLDIVPPEFHRVLFAESIGQLAELVDSGSFPEQIAYLPATRFAWLYGSDWR